MLQVGKLACGGETMMVYAPERAGRARAANGSEQLVKLPRKNTQCGHWPTILRSGLGSPF
jgi:hypothetical protein